MIDWSVFRPALPCLLRETGDLVDANNTVVTPSVARAVLLSRALCRFRFFLRPCGLSSREAEDAALLYAEAHAPFARADSMVSRGSEGFGIWWWDADRLADLVGGTAAYRAACFIPESEVFSVDDSWRQVRTADGYEAQYHQAGALRGSLWRRRPFDESQWRAFCNAIGEATFPAPDTPPSPVLPAWRRDAPWRRARVVRTPPLALVERGGWLAAGASLAVAVILSGHSARFLNIADERRTAIAALQADSVASRAQASTTRNIALAKAAAVQTPLPEHLIAAADLIAAIEEAGVQPIGWESNAQQVRVTGRGQVPVETLGASLEANPRLRNVAPVRDGDAFVITADVQVSNAGLADGAP